MSRIDLLVELDRKAWHVCNEDQWHALCAWRDYAEFGFGEPSESTQAHALDAIEVLLQETLPQTESDVLMTWRGMLEVSHAA